MSAISAILWRGFSFLYGLVGMAGFIAAMARDGTLFTKPSQKETDQVAHAQNELWDLKRSPMGLKHKFFQFRSERRLHYVVNAGIENPNNVIIFIHGFPNSWVLWKHLLISSKLSQNSVLIALDLPGYGGSISLPDHGPKSVLEAITKFVLSMRREYLQADGKVLIVAHDWGGIIAARLASEASQLVDRFIIAGAVIPRHVYANAQRRIASSKQMLHTALRWPPSPRLLARASTNLSPVLSQLGCSYYIFVFNLPWPLPHCLGWMGNMWFLRTTHRVQASNLNREASNAEAAERMAADIGPGTLQNEDWPAPQYPMRVWDGGWSEKIRLYREGLVLGDWEKSLGTIVALNELKESQSHRRHSGTGVGLFDEGPPGALKTAATIVYGRNDPAFDPQLCLEGISDYLTKDSQVVFLEKGGHWLPSEEEGREVLERLIIWSLEDERVSFKKNLEDFPDIRILVEK
ncbi:alpha/beta-hydrolase [Delitschia confertaspora ATCC 74209]|uniref:Alpha/beta-hydrolase n=1 Tax=Delitschia confertaspora ATCC 74209 TaxID=1513339 RepID=A0A9P4JI29_9PLEO|nr:alpha/beta-hydrolase [Delitschia confertaspora ATCC 74209]